MTNTINTIVSNSTVIGKTRSQTPKQEKQTLSNNDKKEKGSKKEKINIKTLWRNTISTRKQPFWQHHRANKKTHETFSNLLQMETPWMLRKFSPRFIKNENKDELKTRHQLAVETFTSEINHQLKRWGNIRNASWKLMRRS